jgi:hypothetical protein
VRVLGKFLFQCNKFPRKFKFHSLLIKLWQTTDFDRSQMNFSLGQPTDFLVGWLSFHQLLIKLLRIKLSLGQPTDFLVGWLSFHQLLIKLLRIKLSHTTNLLMGLHKPTRLSHR